MTQQQPRRRYNNARSIEEIMRNSQKNGFMHFLSNRARLNKIWEQVVGADIAKKTAIISFEVGRLEVSVKGPAYLERYQYYKKEWKKRLNIEFGDDIVDEIILIVGQK
ncbi:MAG: DUF721 domain-containing protein [Deltaproteobacteria bacterium]|jgi:predicted nucleic acid-binding Zn ribbon protein|nr:DUF721 domain-containing protein [Deltaproteobacteria bacterium]